MNDDTQKLPLEVATEAVLFKLNEPVSIKRICEILDKKEDVVLIALKNLKSSLTNRGIDLLENNDEYSLVTAKGTSAIVEKMIKDDINRDLGKASLETLSIVLYKGPLSRREIDYIRGVNSTFILRSLMVRGLIERTSDRQPLYRATSELFAHLGISKVDELPEYAIVGAEIGRVAHEPVNE